MNQNTLKWGSWNVICDRCGRKRKSDEVTEEWTHRIVCRDTCLDLRNPQDFVRTHKDPQTVPFVRTEPANVFASVTYDTTTGVQQNTVPSGTFDNGL